ncbi:EF-hand domain-containing protein [Sphingomonas palmae]|nr:EF-hand domain-containing protein [Sphingomonas palmae]
MRGGGLMRADANHDGIVTREEVIADADRRFAAMDTNGDGTVSRDEMRAAQQARGRGDGAEGRSDRTPPTSATGAPDRRGGARPPLTQQAFRDRALRMFDRADTNHDGRVDAQEMQAMRLLMRARMSGGDDRPGAPPSDEQQ